MTPYRPADWLRRDGKGEDDAATAAEMSVEPFADKQLDDEGLKRAGEQARYAWPRKPGLAGDGWIDDLQSQVSDIRPSGPWELRVAPGFMGFWEVGNLKEVG